MATRKASKPVEPEQLQSYLPALAKQRRSLPNLGFEDKSDAKFSKWHTLTENVVIACFGRESSQHDQYNSLVYKLTDREEIARSWQDLSAASFKRKMTDLLDNFLKELELRTPVKEKRSSGTSIKITNTQTVNQTVVVDAVIKNIITQIKENEPDAERVKQAETNLKEFEVEIKKDKPEWAKIKKSLEWVLNFSKDAFLQILPIIMQKYIK